MWFILTVFLIMLIKKYYDRYFGYEDDEYDYDYGYGRSWDEIDGRDNGADTKDLENKSK